MIKLCVISHTELAPLVGKVAIKFLGSVDLSCFSPLFVPRKFNVGMPMPSFIFLVQTCNDVAHSWLNICRFNSARC